MSFRLLASEYAELTGLTRQAVSNRISRGKLKSEKEGRSKFIVLSDEEAKELGAKEFMEANRLSSESTMSSEIPMNSQGVFMDSLSSRKNGEVLKELVYIKDIIVNQTEDLTSIVKMEQKIVAAQMQLQKIHQEHKEEIEHERSLTVIERSRVNSMSNELARGVEERQDLNKKASRANWMIIPWVVAVFAGLSYFNLHIDREAKNLEKLKKSQKAEVTEVKTFHENRRSEDREESQTRLESTKLEFKNVNDRNQMEIKRLSLELTERHANIENFLERSANDQIKISNLTDKIVESMNNKRALETQFRLGDAKIKELENKLAESLLRGKSLEAKSGRDSDRIEVISDELKSSQEKLIKLETKDKYTPSKKTNVKEITDEHESRLPLEIGEAQ